MKKYWTILCALACSFAFGVGNASAQTINEEARVPKTVWSGYWWPTAKQEILNPLAKYDRLTGANSVAWEKANNPAVTNGRAVPGWVGLCHGWSAAAVMEQEPTKPTRVQNETLTVGDQKAWLSLAHGDDVANFYGTRNDGPRADDGSDLPPELFWEALRSTIKDKKTGIVVDVEAGAQVWNFPAYAYRVQAKKVRGDLYRGTIYVWLASDNVAPDYVGVKTLLQGYPFEARMTDAGVPIAGTGRWIGVARKSHPDFAWVPYVVRSGNAELSYDKVRELLGRGAATPAPEIPANDDGVEGNENEEPTPTPTEEPTPTGETTPTPTGETTPTEEPTPAPAEETRETPASSTDDNGVDEGNPTVSSSELGALLAAVKARGNSFTLDVRVEGMRREFRVGEEFRLEGVSDEAGWLHVVAIDPNGDLVWLYPQPGDNNRVEAKQTFAVPAKDAPYSFECVEPLGYQHVYAFVSEKPIKFGDGENVAKNADGSRKKLPWETLKTRLAPSEKGLAEWFGNLSNEEKAEVVKDGDDVFGRVSCDDFLFEVVAESTGKEQVEAPSKTTEQPKPQNVEPGSLGDALLNGGK